MASRSIGRAEPAPLRAWGRVALIALWLLACLPLHIICIIAGRRNAVPPLFLAGVTRLAGLRVAIQGERLPAPVLHVANHLSWLDILALGGATGTAFVAKAEMAGWPLIGWLTRQSGSLFVDREARRDVSAQADAVRAKLAAHQPLTIFPEGTTGDGAQLLAFHSSLLAGAVPGSVIQPVALDYGSDARGIAWTDDEPFGVNALRLLGRRRPVPLTLRFLEPLPPSLDRKAATGAARKAIADALGHR